MKRLLLLLLLVSTNVLAWSLFSPKDYEECSVQAAKDGRNRDSLEVLLDYCATEFPARRNPEGGYRYYRSATNQWIDVSSPKLSKSDWVKIKDIKPWEMNWRNAPLVKEKNVFDQFDSPK